MHLALLSTSISTSLRSWLKSFLNEKERKRTWWRVISDPLWRPLVLTTCLSVPSSAHPLGPRAAEKSPFSARAHIRHPLHPLSFERVLLPLLCLRSDAWAGRSLRGGPRPTARDADIPPLVSRSARPAPRRVDSCAAC